MDTTELKNNLLDELFLAMDLLKKGEYQVTSDKLFRVVKKLDALVTITSSEK